MLSLAGFESQTQASDLISHQVSSTIISQGPLQYWTWFIMRITVLQSLFYLLPRKLMLKSSEENQPWKLFAFNFVMEIFHAKTNFNGSSQKVMTFLWLQQSFSEKITAWRRPEGGKSGFITKHTQCFYYFAKCWTSVCLFDFLKLYIS